MIIPKIDADAFIETVRRDLLIAFQHAEFGYAVAAPGKAFYAPMDHPGGGNLPLEFGDELGKAFIRRMSTPAYRTLRPTAKPIVTPALTKYLESFSDAVDPMDMFRKAAGDHPAVVDYACQVVILAIEENANPELKSVMNDLKRDEMSDALDLVIQHAESARELCEVGEGKTALIKLYLMQSCTAMKSALEMLLQP